MKVQKIALVTYSPFAYKAPENIRIFQRAQYANEELLTDIINQKFDVVYVYVGIFENINKQMAEDFLRGLVAANQNVIMVGCNCDHEAKWLFANELGISWLGCRCGGDDVFLKIVFPSDYGIQVEG